MFFVENLEIEDEKAGNIYVNISYLVFGVHRQSTHSLQLFCQLNLRTFFMKSFYKKSVYTRYAFFEETLSNFYQKNAFYQKKHLRKNYFKESY